MSLATWFYEPLPPSRFVIQEHLRQTYWRAGLSTLWIETRTPSAPYQAEGRWHDVTCRLEWEPAAWLTLSLTKEAEPVVRITSLLLGFSPQLRYLANGQIVYEWRTGERTARWHELQSNGQVQDLALLSA
jgi:hypothetical protein